MLIKHDENQGVGGAIKTGYKQAIDLDMDAVVVMAGDAQMNSRYLSNLLDPIIDEKIDYTKGNRLEHVEKFNMPKIRRFGNSVLTLLTKISSGYWNIIDPQNGYTAISQKALKKINFDDIYDRYGFPNDLLIELNINNLCVKDIEMPPIYGDEKSGITIGRYSLKLSWLLLKGFFRRINKKYGGLHFHPLWLFYLGGTLLFLFGLMLSFYILLYRFIKSGDVTANTVLLSVLFLIMGFQSLLFALFFDMESNKHLFGENS